MPTFTMLARSLGRKASAPAPSWAGQSTTLVPGAVGSTYNQQVVAVPTFGTVTYSKVGDSPAWVLVSSSGALTGSPGWVGTTLTQATSQTMSIVVRALDQQGMYADVTLSVAISSTIPTYNFNAITVNGGPVSTPFTPYASYYVDIPHISDSYPLTFTNLNTNATLSTLNSTTARFTGTAPGPGINYTWFQYRVQDLEYQYTDYTVGITVANPGMHISSYTVEPNPQTGQPVKYYQVNPHQWYIEGSNDGANWTTLHYVNTVWNDESSGPISRSYSCSTVGTWSYVRMRILNAGSGYNIWVQEIRYYGNNGEHPASAMTSAYSGGYIASGPTGQSSSQPWHVFDKSSGNQYYGSVSSNLVLTLQKS